MSLTNDTYLPAVYNTGVVRGDDFSEMFTFSIGGEGVDLSEAAIKIQMKTTMNVLIGEWDNSNGVIIDGSSVTWNINDNETADFPIGSHNYDIEMTVLTQKRTYVKGKFTVVKDITL